MEYLQASNRFPLSLNPPARQEVQQMFSNLLHQFSEGSFTEIQLGKYLTDLLTLLSQPQPVPRSEERRVGKEC